MNSTRHSVECFRPLSGSYISQCKRKTKGENHEQFPSPIGELHFSIIPLLFHEIFYLVSVPYRGATFLNAKILILRKTILVSVPYRGATFLNGILENLRKLKSNSFRPLSGSYISQSHPKYQLCIIVPVSVPYRGATFLN